MFVKGDGMRFQIQDKTKKKKFIEQISLLGVKKIPYLLLKSGKERVRAYSGNLSNEELNDLWRLFSIEGIGLYLGKQQTNRRTGIVESRLSLDGLHALKKQINENIIELNKKQAEEWFRGKAIELDKKQQEKYNDVKKGSFIAVKYKEDFIGTGKLSLEGYMISNFLPKERRIRN